MLTGFVLVSFNPEYEKGIYNSLSTNDAIKEINPLFGEYDLMIKVEGKTNKDIEQFVIDEIRTIKGVTNTKILIGSLI